MNPEQVARQQIDAVLVTSGWIIQDYKALKAALEQFATISEDLAVRH